MTSLLEARVAVPECGYRWEVFPQPRRRPGEEVRVLVLNVGRGESIQQRYYNPLLLEKPILFKAFADLEPTEEAVLAFANRYGHLGLDEEEIKKKLADGDNTAYMNAAIRGLAGEPFFRWFEELTELQAAVSMWEALGAGDTALLRQAVEKSSYTDGKPPADPAALAAAGSDALRNAINDRLKEYTSAAMVQRDGRLTLQVEPKNLLGAIWVQFAQAIDGRKTFARCKGCKEWFEIGPQGLRRKQGEFCRNACKSRHYRERQGEARKLHAKGLPLDEIARRVESDLLTVRGWITGTKGGAQDGQEG